MEPKLRDIEAMRAELKESGKLQNFGLAKYEAGPGYQLPNPTQPVIEEEEKIGKSLALGIVTLDNFMFNCSLGTAVNYFNYKTGGKWASHSDEDKFIPNTSWLALQMRNVLCSGDMMAVQSKAVKSVNLKEQSGEVINTHGEKTKKTLKGRENVPVTQCYAFQDGDHVSLLLLNRLFDEPRKIKIQLPFDPAPDATFFSLAHTDPKITNRTEQNVKIEEKKVSDFAKDYNLTLPPSSALVIQVKKKGAP